MKQKYIKISSTAQTLTYLLVVAVFILGRGVFKSNYIVAGILLSTVGFSLNWFIKDKKSKTRQGLINAGYVGVVFLVTYKILKSSFLVEDILFLALESTLIMLAVTSFNSHSPRNLKSIQILSLVAFMCFPIFADTSNLIYLTISILYLFTWGLIIKIQMLSRNKTLSFSVWPSYLAYLLSLSLIFAAANILRKNIVFNVVPKRGYTLETKKFDTPDRLFDLQATLFEATVISVDESPKDRKEIMRNVTSLFQESPDIGEFEKANAIVSYFLQKYGPNNIPVTYGVLGDDGLVDPFKRPGSGIEPWGHDDGVSQKKKKKRNEPRNDGRNQSVFILKKFIALKTDFKNRATSDNILDKVISKDKTLKTKIKISLSLNNIRRATTQKTMNRRIDLLNKNIKALLLDEQTKKQLGEMISNLKEWKLYSIYNNLRNSLKDGLRDADKNETVPDLSEAYGKFQDLEQDSQLRERLKNKVSDFIRKIEKALTVSEISELYKKMESIKGALSKAYPAQKDDFEKSLKAMMDAKMELNLTEAADRLGKKLTKDFISQDADKALDAINSSKKIFEAYKTMLSAQEIEEFLEELKRLENQIKTNGEALNFFESEDWQELANSKIKMFYSKEKEGIKMALKESLLSGQDVKKFMESIDDFSSQKQQDSSRKKKEILEKIQNLSKRGLISKDTASNLNNQLNNLSKITEAENITHNLAERKKKRNSGDYYGKLKGLVELNIIGNEELKKDFDSLLDKMMSSGSMQETALLMKELEDILSEAKLDDALSSEIRKIKDNLDKLKEIKAKSFLSESISSLIDALESLKNMRKGDRRRDLEKVIDSLEENYLKGKKPDKSLMKKVEDILSEAKPASVSPSAKKALKKVVSASPSWQIVVFPKRLVLTQGKKTNVKVIGLYNNSIIKDLTGEVSWTFENSSVARIDSQGVIDTIFTGRTKAVATYGANKSYNIEIIVLEPLGYEVMSLKKSLQ